jgi:general stress protein 26
LKEQRRLWIATKAPYDHGTSRRGDLYFKSGKDTCMSSNLKALHTYFFTGKSSKKSRRLKKKRIIELIITENHGCDPGMGRR